MPRRLLPLLVALAFMAALASLASRNGSDAPPAAPVVVAATGTPSPPHALEGLDAALHARAVAIWTWVAASTPPPPSELVETPKRRGVGGGAGGGGGGSDAGLAGIRACESGGDYATNTGNGYYGAYQFSAPTWRSVGGSGLPSNASPAEQDMRARMLMERSGPGQWPVCGRR